MTDADRERELVYLLELSPEYVVDLRHAAADVGVPLADYVKGAVTRRIVEDGWTHAS